MQLDSVIVRSQPGTAYGGPVRPPAVGVATQVFGARRNLGFTQTRARELIDAALRDGAPNDPAALLRSALMAT
jgi:hypothetical protein